MTRFIIAKNITSNTTITEAVLIDAENAHLRSSYNITKTWLLFSPDNTQLLSERHLTCVRGH